MKAVINNETLLKELKKLSSLIRGNHIIPATSCVLLNFSKNLCIIRGTDMETIFISEIPCECNDTFSTMVDYNGLVEICTSVFAPIQLDLNKTEINIKCGVSKFKLKSQGDETTYIVLPEDDYSIEFEGTGDLFYQISKASIIKSKSPDFVNYNMVCLDIDNKDLKVVGVNPPLAYIKTIDIKTGKNKTVMIPDGFVNLTKSFQDTTLWIGERYIKASYQNTTIMGRLSEQQFVKYKTAIEKKHDYNLVVNKEELLRGVQAISFAINNINNTMCFQFKKDGIKVSSSDAAFGNEGETFVDCDNSVGFDKIYFRVKDFNQIIGCIDGDKLEFSFTDETKTVQCRPVGDETFLALLAPVAA